LISGNSFRAGYVGRDVCPSNSGGNASIAESAKAMGIDWMIHKEINEAIPPAYTKYLGEQWKAQM